MAWGIIIYLLATIAVAKLEAVRISKSRRPNIKHGLSVVYGAIPAIPIIVYFWSWGLPVALLGIRLLVYSPALNLFRGLAWNYTSRTSTSIVDRSIPFVLQRILGALLIAAGVGVNEWV